MHTSKRLIILFIALAITAFHGHSLAGGEASLPKPFVAKYEARYSGIGITATRSLQPLANNTQQLRFHAKSWLAEIEEISQFKWSNEGQIIPEQYSYERTGLGRDRHALLNFDWSTKTVVNNVQHKPWSMQIPDLALDKLSYQLQLRHDLINHKSQMSYHIADGGHLKTYEFEVLGQEPLETKIGKLNTVKVKRIRENTTRVTYLWLAQDWDYLVVKIQQQEDDQDYEINLTSARLDGVEVQGF